MANQVDNDSKILGARIEGYGYPQIVRATGDRMYVAHINDSGELEIHYSDNDGTNWTLDETFNEGTAIEIDMPCLVAYSNGDIALAYCFATDTDIFTIKVQIRDVGTGNWTEVYEVTSVDCNCVIKPLLHVNRYLPNRLHLMYIERGSSSVDVRHDKTDDRGSSWAGITTKNVNTNPQSDYWRAYSLDSDADTGDLYCFTHNTNGSNIAVHRLNSSGTWQANITTSASTFIGMCGLVASGNTKWIVSLVYGYLRIWKTTVLSGSLSTTSLNELITINDGNICCGVDGNDNVYVIYTKPDEKAYIRKYDAETDSWGSESALTSGDGLRPSCEQHVLAGKSFIKYTYYSD